MLLALLFISKAWLIQDYIRQAAEADFTKTGFRCAVAGNLLEVSKVPRLSEVKERMNFRSHYFQVPE